MDASCSPVSKNMLKYPLHRFQEMEKYSVYKTVQYQFGHFIVEKHVHSVTGDILDWIKWTTNKTRAAGQPPKASTILFFQDQHTLKYGLP